MIKNLIFDFGNVLIKYDAEGYATELAGGDGELGAYIYKKTLLNNRVWVDFNLGLYTENEVISVLQADVEPQHRDLLEKYVRTLDLCFKQYDEMLPVLDRAKSLGLKLYLLSNFPKETFERTAPRCPVLEKLDGMVVSCYIHMGKPKKNIFDYLLDKYSLKADECLFADDTKVITDAAERFGICSHTFTTAKLYTEFLKKQGVF